MTSEIVGRAAGARIDGDQAKAADFPCAVAPDGPLFEQFLRRDRDAIHDHGRPIEYLQDFFA